MDKNRKSSEDFAKINVFVTIVAMLIIGTLFFLYLTVTKTQIDEYASYTLRNQTRMAVVSIDAKLNDASRSIEVAAGEVASHWMDNGEFDVVSFVESIEDKYVFDLIEFVDPEGINLMSGDNRFDASDREYYKEGIKGNSGVWINYTPKVSKEFLVNFYTPVVHNGKIVGVLVGALGSKDSLEPLTKTHYFDHDSIGVLYAENERVIAASFGAEGELYPKDIYDVYNITAADRSLFNEHVSVKDGEVFNYEGEMGEGIACVGKISKYDWGIVIIIPSTTFSAVYSDFTQTGIITLGIVLLVVCVYILYMLGINRRRYTVRIHENDDIIKGLSKIYYSLFMIDFTEGTARCLRSRDPAAGRYEIKEGEEFSIHENLMKYLLAGAQESEASLIEPLANPMYLKTMLEDKEFFSINYTRLSGGKGSIDVADMRSEEVHDLRIKDEEGNDISSTRNRYLLGLMDMG